jgi:uncharacterized protein YecE (DUF72 family)
MKKSISLDPYKIGCSGFHYSEWKDNFYPKGLAKAKWFEYYAQQFNTVELNVTFYRTMKPSFFENLYNRSPDDFTFSVKAPRTVTHYNKFNDTSAIVQEFYASLAEGLKEKLGAVLFQLPPSYTYSPEHLEKIISNMDQQYNNVIEFRHRSWWEPIVYTELGKNNICFCTVSYPGLPDPLIVNSPFVYVRLHGVPQLYYSTYSKEYLHKLATELKEKTSIKKRYIYFDNTASLAAIQNANEIKELLH